MEENELLVIIVTFEINFRPEEFKRKEESDEEESSQEIDGDGNGFDIED